MLLTFKTIYLTDAEGEESSPQELPADQSRDNGPLQSSDQGGSKAGTCS